MTDSTSRDVALIVTTTLAAAFNLLIVCVIQFVLMPRVGLLVRAVDVNEQLLRETQGEIKAMSAEFFRHQAAMERLKGKEAGK